MTLLELQEQLQENLISCVDATNGFEGFGTYDISDTLCQVVVDTFSTSFFTGQPPQNVVECLDCGEQAPCLCEEI